MPIIELCTPATTAYIRSNTGNICATRAHVFHEIFMDYYLLQCTLIYVTVFYIFICTFTICFHNSCFEQLVTINLFFFAAFLEYQNYWRLLDKTLNLIFNKKCVLNIDLQKEL